MSTQMTSLKRAAAKATPGTVIKLAPTDAKAITNEHDRLVHALKGVRWIAKLATANKWQTSASEEAGFRNALKVISEVLRYEGN